MILAHLKDREHVFPFLMPPAEMNFTLDTGKGVALYLEDISVSFDGFKALNQLSLYVEDGELLCIIGPNGVGKTTLSVFKSSADVLIARILTGPVPVAEIPSFLAAANERSIMRPS